jgi:para-aminobenzoate synthetase component 1
VLEINLSADDLVAALLSCSKREPVFILDSCGVGHLGSHLLIAGLRPVEIFEVSNADPQTTLRFLDDKLSADLAAIFTLSYEFGVQLQPTGSRPEKRDSEEPDVFIALFDTLIIHDYDTSRTFVTGDESLSRELNDIVLEKKTGSESSASSLSSATSNFSRSQYVDAVNQIQELIRSGDTYQTNLTQRITCDLQPGQSAQSIYANIRRDHPAPFSAFLCRHGSTVVSASPERFFRIDRNGRIESSPIKGTRRRGTTPEEVARLRSQLESSHKDRAENTMIVDLVRNDLGRVCEFGSVFVEKLCEIEEHPTLFHLVSTVRGTLREDTTFTDILRATFPCGSITGAPKIRTMQIIDDIERVARGLSMGAIGMYLPPDWKFGEVPIDTVFDLSVAIRTVVVRDSGASFNVGGGVVIDSEPEKEYEESLLKAQALLTALSSRLE